MPNLQKVPYLDGTVLIDPTANIGQHVVRDGVYEPNLIKLIQHCVKAGYNYVDVGANIGLHTLAAGFAINGLPVSLIGFEPEPTIFQQLKQNCEQNNLKVTLHQSGLGSEPGELILYQSTDFNEGSHSFINRANTAPAGSVPVQTLDFVFTDCDPNASTFIKMDVEGFEAHVIRGGQTWLNQIENAIIMLEVTPPLLAQASGELDLLKELDAAGFDHRIIIEDYDTFDEIGYLRNDYFNIACWKGAKSAEVLAPLLAEISLKHIPFNAPNFIEWQAYSTNKLLPGRSAEDRAHANLIAQLPNKLAELETKSRLQEFEFQSTPVGRLRRIWYSIGAKWGIRFMTDQQSEINQALIEVIRVQQTEIERLRKHLDDQA